MGKKKGKKGSNTLENPMMEDPLDIAEKEERLLDDAAKSMVIKNPLLGTGDVWTEKKLQGLVSGMRRGRELFATFVAGRHGLARRARLPDAEADCVSALRARAGCDRRAGGRDRVERRG